jgi:dolichol-phosphate mannosyltransferase
MSLISFVIPVLNEEKNIPYIYGLLNDAIEDIAETEAEWIFVNDGSGDATPFVLIDLCNKDPRVKAIHLTRNFGHQAAITAGLDFAKGDAIITMDCDGQDPPAVIPEMIAKWKEGNRIVYARRITRKDPFFKRITAKWYYSLLRKFSEIKIPGNIGDFRLIDRSVMDYLSKMREKSRYLRGMIPWLGFKHDFVDFNRPARIHGKTGFSWLKMFRFAMKGILSFSLIPLRLGLIVGIFVILSGMGFFIYLLYRHLFDGQFYKLLEWLAVFNYVLIGFIFILMWIIAEYVYNISNEVKGRPIYVVDSTVNIERGDENPDA